MTRSAQQTYIQRLGFQDKDRSNQRHGLACEYLYWRLAEEKFFSNIGEIANESFDSYVRGIAEENANRQRRIKRKIEEVENASKNSQAHGATAPYMDYYVKHEKQLTDELKLAEQELCFTCKLHKELTPFSGHVDCLPLVDAMKQKLQPSKAINVPISNGKFINGFADVLFAEHFFPKVKESYVKKEKLIVDWDAGYGRSAYDNTLGEVKITPEPAENVIQQIAFYRTFLDVDRVVLLVDYDAPTLKRLTENSNIEVYRLGEKFEQWAKNRPAPNVEEF